MAFLDLTRLTQVLAIAWAWACWGWVLYSHEWLWIIWSLIPYLVWMRLAPARK